MAASALMGATGLAFALSGTYLVVVLAPLLGTLNPSSGSVSIFMSIEHAVLARATPGVDRPRRFARYGLIGAFAAAGALVTGSPDLRGGSACRAIVFLCDVGGDPARTPGRSKHHLALPLPGCRREPGARRGPVFGWL